MGRQRGVLSATSSRKGAQPRIDRPRDLGQPPAASCEQHPSWCGPRHSSSAARPRRQRAEAPSTWPSQALYWVGAGKPQLSELSPAFPRPKKTKKMQHCKYRCGRHNRREGPTHGGKRRERVATPPPQGRRCDAASTAGHRPRTRTSRPRPNRPFCTTRQWPRHATNTPWAEPTRPTWAEGPTPYP